MNLTATITLKNNIPRSGERLLQALERGLYAVGLDTMTDAKKRTPVDTGVLKGSGMTHTPKRDRGSVTVSLTFGGAASSYAIYVHEMTQLHHKVGEAKFLENAVNAMSSKIGPFLTKYVAEEVGRGNAP